MCTEYVTVSLLETVLFCVKCLLTPLEIELLFLFRKSSLKILLSCSSFMLSVLDKKEKQKNETI